MKLRLFWTMLLAFNLVILLSVCGMIGVFSLAAAGIWRPNPIVTTVRAVQQQYAQALQDYYIAQGDSWDNVATRMTKAPFNAASSEAQPSYLLLDTNQVVIASDLPNARVGQHLGNRSFGSRIPVTAHGKTVGTLVVTSGPLPMMMDSDGRPSFRATAWRVIQSFLIAGLALMAMLMALAIVFAGWLNRPLRRINAAARALSNGDLETRVSGASIRELDDLAHSFNAMAGSLSAADQQRRQLTADVAHELRTPLSIMRGRLEGIQDGVYQATPEEIERLLEETTLLERLVEDLRLLALADAGQLPLYPELSDPRDLLEQAAASFAAQAKAHQIALQVQVAESLPTLRVDPQRIAQVLGNLIANALRHTPEGGTITLVAERLPAAGQAELQSGVRFIVRDTGRGIAPADLSQIFDRFWRADRSRRRSSGGAGLGLAIARQIVEAHGGSITASSEIGVGTAIQIDLPEKSPLAQS